MPEEKKFKFNTAGVPSQIDTSLTYGNDSLSYGATAHGSVNGSGAHLKRIGGQVSGQRYSVGYSRGFDGSHHVDAGVNLCSIL